MYTFEQVDVHLIIFDKKYIVETYAVVQESNSRYSIYIFEIRVNTLA